MDSEIGSQVVCGNCNHWRPEQRPTRHGRCESPTLHRLNRTYLLDWCSDHDPTDELRIRLDAEAAEHKTRAEERADAARTREQQKEAAE